MLELGPRVKVVVGLQTVCCRFQIEAAEQAYRQSVLRNSSLALEMQLQQDATAQGKIYEGLVGVVRIHRESEENKPDK